MRKFIGIAILILTLFTTAVGAYIYFKHGMPILPQFSFKLDLNKNLATQLKSPFVADHPVEALPLEKYSIANLRNYSYQPSQIVVTKLLKENDDSASYLFKYQTMAKTMTGVLTLPQTAIDHNATSLPVIILIRGYATLEQYYPGFGTQSAALNLASSGYATLAPDFFGFAEADSEPEDVWEARFIKPINVIELIKSVQLNPEFSLPAPDATETDAAAPPKIKLNPEKIGIWAHSNGGQIAITTLEILSEPIPAALWAPVTAPFPYSILFFTDTNEDEGKEARAWLAMFEKDYDVLKFSITQQLQYLTGPIQIHHGGQDPDALQVWSDNFIAKLKQENTKRKEALQQKLNSTISPTITEKPNQDNNEILPTLPIQYYYFTYPSADHNLQPAENWQLARERDATFFQDNLK